MPTLISVQIAEDGPLSPSGLALIFTVVSGTVLPAVLHPQEWQDAVCWIVNIAMVPSMYMLLTIYAFFNMDDVSWGTRETPKTAAEKRAEEAAAKNEPKEKKKGIRGLVERMSSGNFKISKMFQRDADKMQSLSEKLDRLSDKLDKMEKSNAENNDRQRVDINGLILESKNTQTLKMDSEDLKESKTWSDGLKSVEIQYSVEDTRRRIKTDDEKDQIKKKFSAIAMKGRAISAFEETKSKHFWFEGSTEEINSVNKKRCSILHDAKVEHLDKVEEHFWTNLIEQYLYPLDANKDKQKKEKEMLKAFKNQISLGFILINAILVTVIFMLQLNIDLLGMKWPLEKKGPILTFDTEDVEHSNQVTLTYDYLKLDPIGLLFILLLMGTITLLTIGMFFHRVVTLEQIVADVSIRSKKKDELVERPIDILQEMREEFRGDKNKLRGRGMNEKVKNYLQDNQKI